VQFREAHFHVRALHEYPCQRHGPEPDMGVPKRWVEAAPRDPHALTAERACAVLLPHVTAALAAHAAWYGARCTGLDALVLVDGYPCGLPPLGLAPGIAALPRQGWRSVSVWWPPCGLVLYTASGAPAFLRAGSSRLFRHEAISDILSP
jgi:hypothetical protein